MSDKTPAPKIYVGYLPLPPAARIATFIVAPVLLIAVGIAGAVISASHRAPGPAVWDFTETTWTGRVELEPFPMLVEPDGTAHFVVGLGKFGVADRLAPHDGQLRTLTGFPLSRQGRRMIELLPGEDAIAEATGVTVPNPPAASLLVELVARGEIVDGKCYLGAMKPGDGAAHKSCAILCIEGGLPPLVVLESPDAPWLFPLLRVDGSTDLPQHILDLVGEPVTITGTLSTIGGLPVLDVEATGITRAR